MSVSNPPPLPRSKTSGLAIWSLVLGILSLTCFSIFTAIPGVICGHSALGKIKRSAGTLEGKGLAIAGLITGYLGVAFAIVLIPLSVAIAVPNFAKARAKAQRISCIHQLRLIDAAKRQWALEKQKQEDELPTEIDLTPFLGLSDPVEFLRCPAGGVYTIKPVNERPTCSIADHSLPPVSTE